MNNFFDLLIEDASLTCIVLEDNQILFTSTENGVKPLLDFYGLYGKTKKDLTVIDKIMGRGAVLLAILIQASELYTPIISEAALELAKEYHVLVHYQTLVPYIVNRNKDGRCPIESSVLEIHDIEKGYEAIRSTLAKLRK